MRALFPIVAILFAATGATAQTRVGSVVVRAEETSCLSNSYAPCEDIGDAAVRVTTGARAARIRIVRVEARSTSTPNATWQRATGQFILLVGQRRINRSSTRLGANRAHQVRVFFDAISIAGDAMIRTTLEVNGRTVTIEAPHVIWHESPDPDF